MINILIINASEKFSTSEGKLNNLISQWDLDFFNENSEFQISYTRIVDGYNVEEEIKKFREADYLIYHFPIWWMYVPNHLKKYLDEVFTSGHGILYKNDGRKSDNPSINYGTGGLLQSKKYMVTTTWNAPEAAFTLPNEFFEEKSVDEGIYFLFIK